MPTQRNDRTDIQKATPARRKVAKIIVLSALGALALYCLYASIGQYIMWLQQPRFVSLADGGKAWSAGFIIQTSIFAVLFLLLAGVEIFLGFKFFRRKRKTR